MSLDEVALQEWVHRVAHGMADRRAFLRYMMGLGLSGPFLGNLLATYAPAQAQTPRLRRFRANQTRWRWQAAAAVVAGPNHSQCPSGLWHQGLRCFPGGLRATGGV